MSFRIAITKIRLSSYHCLMECPKYSNERNGCMPEVLKNRPIMHEFVNLFKCTNEEVFKE